MSQHCLAQHASCVGHRVAKCCDLLGVVGSNLTGFKLKPKTPNMSQHIATRWPNASNMLHTTSYDMLRWNVAIVWQGLKTASGGLHHSIRQLGSTANSKARWRKNIRIGEKIVYTTKISGFRTLRVQSCHRTFWKVLRLNIFYPEIHEVDLSVASLSCYLKFRIQNL